MNAAPISPAALPPEKLEKFRRAAQDFEAMAIGQLLAPMFETVDQSASLFGGGPGEKAWQPMLVSSIAKQMAANGGLGLAQPVMRQMILMQEKHDAAR